MMKVGVVSGRGLRGLFSEQKRNMSQSLEGKEGRTQLRVREREKERVWSPPPRLHFLIS